MIDVRDVTKRYGTVTALDGVSLSVQRGDALGMVGTNGAGKTTLFRLLVGHETPDSGTVKVAGVDPSDGPHVRDRVGFLPEQADFEPSLTAREVLRFHARLRSVPQDQRKRRIERVLETVGLRSDASRRVGTYSNGMTRRLGLATTLLADPQVLLLDEPTAGLDPNGVAAFNRIVERIRTETEVTIVLTSHVLDEVERLCDQVAIIDSGRIRAVGPVAEVRRQAGDRVTVTATVSADADRKPLTTLQRDFPSVSVTDGGNRIELTCPRDTVFEVLDVLSTTEVESLEVSEPGLEAAFRDFVAGDVERIDDAQERRFSAFADSDSADSAATVDAQGGDSP